MGLRRPTFGRGRDNVTLSKDGDASSRPRGRGGVASRGGPSERERANDLLAIKPYLNCEEWQVCRVEEMYVAIEMCTTPMEDPFRDAKRIVSSH